ncbi:hypothetical protein D3C81_1377360 [compost metagenome]
MDQQAATDGADDHQHRLQPCAELQRPQPVQQYDQHGLVQDVPAEDRLAAVAQAMPWPGKQHLRPAEDRQQGAPGVHRAADALGLRPWQRQYPSRQVANIGHPGQCADAQFDSQPDQGQYQGQPPAAHQQIPATLPARCEEAAKEQGQRFGVDVQVLDQRMGWRVRGQDDQQCPRQPQHRQQQAQRGDPAVAQMQIRQAVA